MDGPRDCHTEQRKSEKDKYDISVKGVEKVQMKLQSRNRVTDNKLRVTRN